jgi:hypothetical protein
LSPRPQRLAALAGLVALLLAAFWPVVARRQTLFPPLPGVLPPGPAGPAFLLDPMDTGWQNYPLARFVNRSWRAGTPPIWNRYSGCGEPLIVSGVGAATSPLRWWTALAAPSPAAWDFFLLARLALAGVLAFLFASRLGAGLPGAFTAGAAFMLSGHLVLNLNQAFIDSEVLIPAVGLGVLSACAGGVGGWAWLALAGGALILGGQPQSAFTAGLFALALAAAVSARSRRPLAALARVAGGGAVAVALGSPFLFSFLDFLPRAQHVHAGQGLASEPLAGAVSLVAPWLLGRFGESWLGMNPFRFLPYIGLSVFLLAVAGSRSALARPGGWALVAVPAFLLAGAYGIPPVSWLAHLPLLDSLWWAKYQGPTVLSLAVLAGFAVDEIFRRRAWPALLAAAVVAGELFLLMPRKRPAPFDPLPSAGYVETLAGKMDLLNERVWGTGRAFMPHCGAALGIPDVRTYFAVYPRRDYWYVRGIVTGPSARANDAVFTGSPRQLPALASPGLSALSAGWVVSAGEPGDLAEQLEPPGELSWIEAAGLGRPGRVLVPGGPPLKLSIKVPPGGAELSGRVAAGGGGATLAVSGPEKLLVRARKNSWTNFRVRLPAGKPSLEFRAGGGWVILSSLVPRAGGAQLGADGLRAGWVSRFRPESDGKMLLMRNPARLPRARMVGRAVRVTGPEQALFEASGNPAGGRTAYVEGPADWMGFHMRPGPGLAKVVSDSGREVVCTVSGRGDRILVLADTFEPGWRAYGLPGGRRLRVLPADCMFRAVAVPPETSRVIFRYEPFLLKLGILLAGLGLGLCVPGLAPFSGPFRRQQSAR